MTESYAGLMHAAREWFERGAADGWLDASDRRRFGAVEQATPADLFAEEQMRPLVAALFGGTGVGKSSLLNRLAGEPIARVGVERPTSHDVTLYVHESVKLADLPPELPVDRVQVRRHTSAAQRDVLWIDAPDIDSTDQTNRQCALAWLPHVDLLCYVVSPERYRDDAGWRVLRERGHKHGWMFVMNRWDEGDQSQRDDFARMLRAAGFETPLLWCTCCTNASVPSPDQFGQIQATLRELMETHAVNELTRLGHRARLQELRGALDELLGRFGDDGQWKRVETALEERWRQTRAKLSEGAEWGMQTIAARFAIREGGLMGRIGQQVAQRREGTEQAASAGETQPDAGELTGLTEALWDDWHQSKVVGCLDGMEVAAGQAGLAAQPIRRRLEAAGAGASALLTEQMQDSVRAALVRPGNTALRIARRVTGFLVAAMPAAALALVGYNVVVGYLRATFGSGAFSGVGFAAQSVLLVVVAWALPFSVDRLLRPSLERIALRALREGFRAGLDGLEDALRSALTEARDEARGYHDEGRNLVKTAAAVMVRPVDARNESVVRLLADSRATGGPAGASQRRLQTPTPG